MSLALWSNLGWEFGCYFTELKTVENTLCFHCNIRVVVNNVQLNQPHLTPLYRETKIYACKNTSEYELECVKEGKV